MSAESGFHRRLHDLKTRFLSKSLSVYPSYGYRDPQEPDTWIVPIRVWIYDNRDTPFAERAIEHWAVRHFEADLQRPLEDHERVRLKRILEHFIADDQSNESVELVFAEDPHERVFALSQRSTANGVIEENLRVPNELVQELYQRSGDENRWLRILARTADGHGAGEGLIRFLEPEGLSIVSDIDDTIKVTHVTAGKRTVLRNTFLNDFQAAAGMQLRYRQMAADAGPSADVCFHYVSGSPWQLFAPLREFLLEREGFPLGTFHMKNLRKNLREAGALESIQAFALGGDLATLEQKIRQITNLMIHLPHRRFILIGDSGERDPEVYRAIRRLFPAQVQRIIIRDVLRERLAGMELIPGDDQSVFLDTSDLEAEITALVGRVGLPSPDSPKL